MTPPLVGRDRLVARVAARLARGESVLLVGPAGIGKSAVVAALARPGLVVVDPFEGIATRLAGRLRRALDRGAPVLGAGRSAKREALGHAGRIAWRLAVVRVPPLPAPAMRAVIRQALDAATGGRAAPPARWLTEAARVARGRPGHGVALAQAAAAGWRRDGRWPAPRVALVDGLVGGLTDAS